MIIAPNYPTIPPDPIPPDPLVPNTTYSGILKVSITENIKIPVAEDLKQTIQIPHLGDAIILSSLEKKLRL